MVSEYSTSSQHHGRARPEERDQRAYGSGDGLPALPTSLVTSPAKVFKVPKQCLCADRMRRYDNPTC